MKIKYKLDKNSETSSTYNTYDGYSSNIIFDNNCHELLEGVFNFRTADSRDWDEIITDINLILSTPSGENIYNEDGSLSGGRYNIEQDNRKTTYYLRVCIAGSEVYEVDSYAYRDWFYIYSPDLDIKIPTLQILPLFEKWRDFLSSEVLEEAGEIELDIHEV